MWIHPFQIVKKHDCTKSHTAFVPRFHHLARRQHRQAVPSDFKMMRGARHSSVQFSKVCGRTLEA